MVEHSVVVINEATEEGKDLVEVNAEGLHEALRLHRDLLRTEEVQMPEASV